MAYMTSCTTCGGIWESGKDEKHEPDCPELSCPCNTCPKQRCPGPCNRYDTWLSLQRDYAKKHVG